METTEKNRTVSKQTETNQNNPKFSEKDQKICSLSNCFGWSSVCFGSIETSKLSVSVQNQNNRNKQFRNKPKQTETNQNNPKFRAKNTKICSLSHCFGCSSVCFGSIETPKLSVLVQNRNNRNKCYVSDSAETSFSSSFGSFESKLVYRDTIFALDTS